jgi:hypothetical protein
MPEGHWAELPIEYINNNWYLLEWDEDSYWVSSATVIQHGTEGLGHDGLAPPPSPSTSQLPPHCQDIPAEPRQDARTSDPHQNQNPAPSLKKSNPKAAENDPPHHYRQSPQNKV